MIRPLSPTTPPSPSGLGRTALLACAALAAAVLSACGPSAPPQTDAAAAAASGTPGAGASNGAASAPAAGASAPPVSVTLVRAAARDFTIALEASGTVTAQSSVDVKPQVSAQVLAVQVKEGQFVQKGQPLFTLDARIDQANLKKAEAQLLKDQATLADAQRQLARSQELLAQNFISRGAVDTALANVEAQQAALAADRAAIDALKAQLSYARISAPSAGRVGTIAVFPGSSVSPSGPALLTITQIDPVAVAFSLPQRNVGDALKLLAAGQALVTAQLPDSPAAAIAAAGASAAGARGASAPGSAPASAPTGAKPAASAAGTAAVPASAPASAATGARGAGGPGRSAGPALRQGKLVFVDSAVDASSGTVKVKALFDNKDQALWPGAFVSVKLALQTLPGAIVVPQAAIVQGARGTAVFVAGPGNVAALRPVKIITAAGADAVVSGLKPGERVVLDGRQNVRPGALLIERAAEGGRGAAGARGAASGAAAGAASGASGS